MRTDRDVLDDLADSLEDLQRSTGAPVTARRLWLQQWLSTERGYQPLVLGLGSGDRLDAVALLATTSLAGITTVVPMGHGPSDVVTMSARDGLAADRLASHLADHLRTLRPWRLSLRHTVRTDPVLVPLAARLRRVRILDGDLHPVLCADRGPSLDHYVTGSHRRGVSRLRNRIARDGLALEVEHLRTAAEIAAALPEVERVHRLRDDHVGRASAMDDQARREFFRRVVRAHAEAGEVSLTVLRLEGRLAAYVLCFVDRTEAGAVYRMWNPRFDPEFSRYSPGKVSMDESVAHALEEGAVAYDFMRGEERYKAGYANAAERALDLHAWSNAVLERAERAALAARDRVRAMERAGGRQARLAELVRGLQ